MTNSKHLQSNLMRRHCNNQAKIDIMHAIQNRNNNEILNNSTASVEISAVPTKHGLKKYGLEMSYLISFDKTSGVAYNSS